MRYLSEDEIERRVEKMIDHLDRVFMSGGMSQKNYDKSIAETHKWAEAMYQGAALAKRINLSR